MPTFLDFLMNDTGSVDVKQSFDVGGQFVQKLASFKESVVGSFLHNNIDMNQSIAKIATDENLNDNQIQRIVEEANNHVFLAKYAQYSNNIDREVRFPIADPSKIKAIMEGKQTTASSLNDKMEKKASYENDDANEALNAFNSLSYGSTSLALEKEADEKDIFAKEFVRQYNERTADFEKKAAIFNASIYEFAEALVAMDRQFADTQEIFKQACVGSGLKIDKQQAVKIAICEKVASLKEDNVLPQEYNIRLENVDTSIKEKQYSLKNGFFKEASVIAAGKIPEILTESGHRIKGIPDMVKLASAINTSFVATEESSKRLEILKSKIEA